MPTLTHLRCFNHVGREAVARCPECKQFFCRECVTEHADRVVCSACLKKLAQVSFAKRPAFLRMARLAQCGFAILAAWFFFFLIGEALLKIPASFHEGTLWRANATGQE
jgi:hypothetical protein